MIGVDLEVLFGEIEVTKCRKQGKCGWFVYDSILTCVFVCFYGVLPYSWVTNMNIVCMSNCFAYRNRFLCALYEQCIPVFVAPENPFLYPV